jgi:hypothetical protein
MAGTLPLIGNDDEDQRAAGYVTLRCTCDGFLDD